MAASNPVVGRAGGAPDESFPLPPPLLTSGSPSWLTSATARLDTCSNSREASHFVAAAITGAARWHSGVSAAVAMWELCTSLLSAEQ